MLWRGRNRLNLALQGGGAHGAFTWGVLDRLLEEEDFEIGCISGTSAGAVNAVALAAGFAQGGRTAARDRLTAVWSAIARSGVPDFMRGIARTSMAHILNVYSPYEFNPLGFDPLRNLLNEHIDFDRVRKEAPFELLIAATEVASGRARLFRRSELTVDCVLASACLPALHRAVEIEGRHYWDGGFSANPELIALAGGGFAGDTLLVQLDPTIREGVPVRAKEIASEVNRLTFNQPLMRDLHLIAEIQSIGAIGAIGLSPAWRRIHSHRFHLIEADAHTKELSPESKGEPDKDMLAQLHMGGRAEANQWLKSYRHALGRRSSVDFAARLTR